MSSTSFSQQFSRLLDNQLELAEALAGLLREEQAVLGHRDTQALTQLAERKLVLSGQLEQQTGMLAKLLSENGLRLDRSGIQQCLNTPELEKHWHNLQELLTGCRDDNHVNGNIIEVSKHTTQKMLRLLTGDSDATELYGSAGKVEHGMGSSRLAKA